MALRIVVEEKEEPIVNDWTANSHSELIQVVVGLDQATSVVGPAICIEVVIAEEFVTDAMEGIGPRLSDNIENTAARAPKFGSIRFPVDSGTVT